MAQINTQKMAEKIYSIVYGHLDDRRFHHEQVEQINAWLENGVLNGDETAEQLAEEWREYADEHPLEQ